MQGSVDRPRSFPAARAINGETRFYRTIAGQAYNSWFLMTIRMFATGITIPLKKERACTSSINFLVCRPFLYISGFDSFSGWGLCISSPWARSCHSWKMMGYFELPLRVRVSATDRGQWFDSVWRACLFRTRGRGTCARSLSTKRSPA